MMVLKRAHYIQGKKLESLRHVQKKKYVKVWKRILAHNSGEIYLGK
jgi:hypothetical protein